MDQGLGEYSETDHIGDDPASTEVAAVDGDVAATGLSRVERLKQAPMASWVTFVVVTLASALVFWRLHPSKIFLDTTPAGGDMGAHVWGPAYLRDNLLSNWSLRGWTMDWYGGFPALQFYMILPYLLIVILDVVLPYVAAATAATTTTPDVSATRHDDGHEPTKHRGPQRLGHHGDPSTIKAVKDDPCGKGEHQERQKLKDRHHRDQASVVGDLDRQQRHRHQAQPVAKIRRAERGPQRPEATSERDVHQPRHAVMIGCMASSSRTTK